MGKRGCGCWKEDEEGTEEEIEEGGEEELYLTFPQLYGSKFTPVDISESKNPRPPAPLLFQIPFDRRSRQEGHNSQFLLILQYLTCSLHICPMTIQLSFRSLQQFNLFCNNHRQLRPACVLRFVSRVRMIPNLHIVPLLLERGVLILTSSLAIASLSASG